MKGFQPYLSFTIGLFSIISRTLVGEVLPLCREAVGVFYIPSRLNKKVNDVQYVLLIKLDIRFFFIIPSYLPTPPLGQDMTQGQFLSGV